MTSFQALATAIAAQVGTGNIAGCATALVSGGPGAIFWMWLAAFFGMATIYGEAYLAQISKRADESGESSEDRFTTLPTHSRERLEKHWQASLP